MKPLLASLVLLLLALCRSSAQLNFKVVSVNTKSTKAASSITFVPPAERAAAQNSMAESVKKEVKKEVTAEQIMTLIDAMGNFPFFSIGDGLNRVPYLVDALANGVFCDTDPGNLKFKDELNAATNAIISRAEQETAYTDCGNSANAAQIRFNTCFCTNKNSVIYCAVDLGTLMLKEKYKTTKTCRPAALDALKAAGTGALAKDFEMDGFVKRDFASEFAGKDVGAVTKNEDAETAKLFCDATDPTVEKAVKDLYAADGLYWIAESLLFSIVFGTPTKTLPEICAEPHYQNNVYGKCVCKLDTGFTFCIYKVLGEFFREKGYLDCTPKTFVKEKKPETLPQLVKASETAFSLTMVPLMAAAVLFARH